MRGRRRPSKAKEEPKQESKSPAPIQYSFKKLASVKPLEKSKLLRFNSDFRKINNNGEILEIYMPEFRRDGKHDTFAFVHPLRSVLLD